MTGQELEDMKEVLNGEIRKRDNEVRNTPEYKTLAKRSKELDEKYNTHQLVLDVVIPISISVDIQYYKPSGEDNGQYEFDDAKVNINGTINSLSTANEKLIKRMVNEFDLCEDTMDLFKTELNTLTRQANKEFKEFYKQVEKAGYDLGDF